MLAEFGLNSIQTDKTINNFTSIIVTLYRMKSFRFIFFGTAPFLFRLIGIVTVLYSFQSRAHSSICSGF